ncbi:hypothetical protein F2Q68_00034721 [Brassica cretica]|uniref:Uncharacterized protein n=1 Tax=Brassica cretica TaxID=69181 RepID=A0A8S9H376_BRACR|nr:hypothetical protein F2Q68_00034721 [Brassica cretica]
MDTDHPVWFTEPLGMKLHISKRNSKGSVNSDSRKQEMLRKAVNSWVLTCFSLTTSQRSSKELSALTVHLRKLFQRGFGLLAQWCRHNMEFGEVNPDRAYISGSADIAANIDSSPSNTSAGPETE